MEIEENIKKHLPLVKKNILPLSLAFFGLIFLSYGLIALIGGVKSSSDSIVFEGGLEQTFDSSNAATSSGQIIVDIEGAVLKPGVYKVSSSSRLQDALVAAGGLSEAADREWVSKNLNLAQKLTDGAKIYVPKTGENVKDGINVGVGIENALKGKINVNTASIKELDGLPGVGIVTAQKIIDGRPYGTIDDLLSKKVVNSKVFEQIREKITVY